MFDIPIRRYFFREPFASLRNRLLWVFAPPVTEVAFIFKYEAQPVGFQQLSVAPLDKRSQIDSFGTFVAL